MPLPGAAVHSALGHGGQLLIGRFFLIEILLKQSARRALRRRRKRTLVGKCTVAGSLCSRNLSSESTLGLKPNSGRNDCLLPLYSPAISADRTPTRENRNEG
jgi:hypothetical protein